MPSETDAEHLNKIVTMLASDLGSKPTEDFAFDIIYKVGEVHLLLASRKIAHDKIIAVHLPLNERLVNGLIAKLIEAQRGAGWDREHPPTKGH